MVSQSSRPTLMAHLGIEAMARIIQKGLFGRPYVRFYPFLMVGCWLYQTGAILGRARPYLDILARMFSEPGREREVYKYLLDLSAERIARYGKLPDSFFDFFMTTEYQKAGITWPPPNLDVMKRIDNKKIPLEQAEPIAKWFLLEGIGFGAAFPDLTERMWRQTYETHDPELWARARRAGLEIPEQFAPLPLEEMEQIVLLEVASYAMEYFPELVEPLGLRLT